MASASQRLSVPFLRIGIVIRNTRDFSAGVLFAGAGAFFSYLAQSYTLGQASQMGPGYFPFWVGVILALIGVGLAVKSLGAKAPEAGAMPSWNWRSLFWVLAATVGFAFALEHAGLVLSTVILVVLSSRASHEFTWRGALATAAAIVGISLVAFVWLLKVDIPTWPPIITG